MFLVSIPRGTTNGTTALIQMINLGSTPVQVVVTYLGNNYTTTIQGNNANSIVLQRPVGSSSDPAVITATGAISATVFLQSCSAYLALQNAALGTSYQVITWNASYSYIAISAVSPSIVFIAFPSSPTGNSNCQIQSGDTTFFCGDTFGMSLSAAVSTYFNSSSDLSGTYILSDHPISVVVGTSAISIGPGNIVDTTASEVFPIASWGDTFIASPFPNDAGTGYTLKIISANQTAAVVVVADSVQTATIQPGTAWTVQILSNSPAVIDSDVPVQVMQFIDSGNVGGSTFGRPASLTIPPVVTYALSYSFSLGPTTSFTNFISVVAENSSASGIQLNNQPVPSNWLPVPGIPAVVQNIPVSGSFAVISHPSTPFGAYVFAYTTNDPTYGSCAFAYPAGAVFPPSVQVSSTATTATTVMTSSPTTSATTSSPSNYNVPIINDCSCLNVSSQVQPSYSGYYYIINQTLNGSPIYKRNDCNVYLYLFQGPNATYWLLGPTLGASQGAVENAAIYEEPYLATHWTSYNQTAQAWMSDPSFQDSCSCPGSICASVEFINITNGWSIFDGVFTEQLTTFNGRPVYEHDSLDLYFYFEVSGSCQYWAVGDTIGATNAVLYANDLSYDPDDISSNTVWQYSQGGSTFNSNSQITLQCYTSPLTST